MLGGSRVVTSRAIKWVVIVVTRLIIPHTTIHETPSLSNRRSQASSASGDERLGSHGLKFRVLFPELGVGRMDLVQVTVNTKKGGNRNLKAITLNPKPLNPKPLNPKPLNP